MILPDSFRYRGYSMAELDTMIEVYEKTRMQGTPLQQVMRAMKFRLWHDDLMYAVYELVCDANGVRKVHAQNDEKGARYHAGWPSEKYILMPFTGLTDHHGCEIYEGDIIDVKGPWETHRAQVIWDLSQPLSLWEATVTWLLRFPDRQEGDNRQRVVGPLYPYCQPRSGYDVKVVGNTYENPDFIA